MLVKMMVMVVVVMVVVVMMFEITWRKVLEKEDRAGGGKEAPRAPSN